jgi:hypothetical protein
MKPKFVPDHEILNRISERLFGYLLETSVTMQRLRREVSIQLERVLPRRSP